MKVLNIILEELKSLFRNPHDRHRVIMVMPLGAMLSHALFLVLNSDGLPLKSEEIVSIVLVSILYTMILFWVIFSNDIHFRLAARLSLMAGYGALLHRTVLGVSNVTGVPLYEMIFFMVLASIVAFFVVTGFSINEVKDRYHEFTENRPKDPGSSAIPFSRSTSTG